MIANLTTRLPIRMVGRLLLVLALVFCCACAFADDQTDSTANAPSTTSTASCPTNSLSSVITDMAENAVGEVSSFMFFQTINSYLGTEIDYLQWTLINHTASVILTIAMTLLIFWIMYQGFRIITGRTQMPMMALVGDSLKAFLVITVAFGMANSSNQIYWTLTDGTVNAIYNLVSPNANPDGPYAQIDTSLAEMDGMLGVLDILSSGATIATGTQTDVDAQTATTRAKWFTGIGIAGPSVVGGAVLLLNKIAIALFVGLGPLFILCLLFDYTKGLFQRWLFYGIGTLFSLAILSFMVTISTSMVQAVVGSILLQYATLLASCEWNSGALSGLSGVTSMAMQQGGLGLLLTTLIVSAPPMAAAFFQGTLGQFGSGYSAFGHAVPQSTPGKSSSQLTSDDYAAITAADRNLANTPTSSPQ